MAKCRRDSPDPSQATCSVFTLKTSGGGKAFAALADCSIAPGYNRAPRFNERGVEWLGLSALAGPPAER